MPRLILGRIIGQVAYTSLSVNVANDKNIMRNALLLNPENRYMPYIQIRIEKRYFFHYFFRYFFFNKQFDNDVAIFYN